MQRYPLLEASAGAKCLPRLDPRLRAACTMVQPCEVCADIGADHGLLSAALLLENRAKRMLVSDISAPSLRKAEQLLASLGLTDRAVFKVADGLGALDALGDVPASCLCILGMGGDSIGGILRRGQSRLHGAAAVLGAHTELPRLRQAVCDIGYRIRQEELAEASGHCYLVMRITPASPEEAPYDEKQLLLGPCLAAEKPPEWAKWLGRRQRVLQVAVREMRKARHPKDELRLHQVETELAYVNEALDSIDASE